MQCARTDGRVTGSRSGTSAVQSPKKHAATRMTFIIVPMVNVKRGRLFVGGLNADGGPDE